MSGSAGTTFPGGTSVTLLDVYDSAAPDDIVGGSPHMHLASTECYVVVAGSGELHTLTPAGFAVTPLEPGSVVWFTPGTIHRAVNHGRLQVVVVMGNAGLPEAGDAVMTFPADIVADPDRYRAAAALPAGAERADAATRRRDLAVEGFGVLRDASIAGDAGPLREFFAAAARLVAGRATAWEKIVRSRPLAQATDSLAAIATLGDGGWAHLDAAAVHSAPPLPDERGYGMCGRLRAYDVANGPAIG